MTDQVGRHAAAAADTAETLILPVQAFPDEDGTGQAEPVRRSAGRHASGRPAAEPGSSATDFELSPADAVQTTLQPVDILRPAAKDPLRNGHHPAQAGHAAAASGANRRDTARGPGQGGPPSTQARPSAAHRPAARGDSQLRLVWVYPDLLSTYGDRGNLLVLSRRARLRGIEVQAVEVNSDQPVPGQGDIYLLGGGEDLPQILAANRLRADGGLAAAAARGAVVFAVCAGYQVLGHKFGGVEGEPVTGLGVLDISSGRGERRGVGELVADVDPTLSVPRLTGFENHQGVTKLGPRARPLASVSLGVGNGDGTEGAYAGKVLGTYMHGPALARNPGLADLLLSWAAGPLKPLDPDAEEWASQLRAERLAAVGS
jgi:lipid II isoglutaminyl synthase (glutamine-hydrolysing)